jgi:hypothetical protein
MRRAALLLILAGCGQSLVDFFTGGPGPTQNNAADLAVASVNDLAMTTSEDLAESGGGDAATTDAATTDAGTTDAGTDATPSSDDLSTAGADLTSPASCSAALLGGGNDRINAANIAAQNTSGAVTVEAWIFPTALANANQVIIAHWSGTNAGQRAYRLRIDNGGHVVFDVSVAGGPVNAVSTGTVSAAVWTHVAGVFNPGATNTATVRAFINGTGTVTTNFSAASTNTSTNGLNLGNLSNSSAPFAGYLSDVRVEAAQLYSADFTPPATITADANTVALYHLAETTGTTAADSATGANRPNNATLLNGAAFAMPPTCR